MIWPFQSKYPSTYEQAPEVPVKRDSYLDFSDVVFYEEKEIPQDAAENSSQGNSLALTKGIPRNSMRIMHHFIPPNPFRATVRLRQPKLDAHQGNANTGQLVNFEPDYFLDADSPASFPPTPFSRAYIMNKASERVVNVMFGARDLLRLEAQSVSRDEYSRMVAKETQKSGHLAVFDPEQSSNMLALTCANHCVMKVGQGLCGSSRSMIPLRYNSYVYFEFTVTLSGAQQHPQLGIGLTPPDCPLNVMVGSWPRSVGLYFDGQVLIDSQWYQSRNPERIVAGSVVGVLAYLPSSENYVRNSFPGTRIAKEDSKPELTLPAVSSPSSHDSSSNSIDHGGNAINRPASESQPTLLLNFNINGVPMVFPAEAYQAMQDLSLLDAPFHPTVSLFSEDTRVWCRFCEADIVYKDRQHIKAPAGVRVYCLDGTLLLSEED